MKLSLRRSKRADDVKVYTKVFWKRWHELEDRLSLYASQYSRLVLAAVVSIERYFLEGEVRREKQDNLQPLLDEQIKPARYPMQELKLNNPVAKDKEDSEEEDSYIRRLNCYGMKSPDVYDWIKKDITEFPVFRFDHYATTPDGVAIWHCTPSPTYVNALIIPTSCLVPGA
jgi:SWI/SNF-related matrix-associated actin-dependent regulator of chromatin subfamily A member 5